MMLARHLSTRNADDRHLLDIIYAERKEIFCDSLGWVPPKDSVEYDEFDDEHAHYIALLKDDRLLASVRLLPTERPHLMTNYFPHLCSLPIPQAPNVLEASRLCISPSVPVGPERKVLTNLAIAAAIEHALILQANTLTFVLAFTLYPYLLNPALKLEPLGMPTADNQGQLVSAWQMPISLASLDSFYQNINKPRLVIADHMTMQAAS